MSNRKRLEVYKRLGKLIYPDTEAMYRLSWSAYPNMSFEGRNIAFDLAARIKKAVRVSSSVADVFQQKAMMGAQEYLRNRLTQLSRRVYDNKRPPQTGEWVSVEIECFVPRLELEAIAIAVRKAGLVEYVTIKNDGSLHGAGDEYIGKEYVVSFPKDNPRNLAALCAILKDKKARVNKTCGLHVHFDMRTKTSRQATFIGKRVARCVPALKAMLPMSRRNNQFCRQDISSRGERYAFVNTTAYRRHQTLEIRGHSGTTSFTKIINWIGVLQCIMNSRLPKDATFQTMDDVLRVVHFPAQLVSYIRDRVATFTTETAEEAASEAA